MKYIVIGNRLHEENDLLYDLAGFLWNAGNEVFISEMNSTLDYRHIAGNHCSVILLIPDICFDECLFTRKAVKIDKDFELEMNQGGQPIFVLSENGVYSNTIPYPHKLFHFDQLTRNDIGRFFDWHTSFMSVLSPQNAYASVTKQQKRSFR